MGDVDHHAQAVHLKNNLLAEIGESVVVLNLGIVEIAGGIGPFVGIRPGEGHVAHTKAVEIAQEMNIVLDGMSALDAQQGRKLSGFARPLDICD